MKKLFSDKVIAKLRVVPTPVWFIFLAISCFFVQCRTTVVTAGEAIATFNEAWADLMAETGESFSINTTAFTVFTCIFSGLVSAAITEAVIYIVYAFTARRFFCAINQKDFSFRARILIIIVNLIVGVFSLTSFIHEGAGNIVIALINITVPALFIAWYYEDYRVRFVPKRNHASLFRLFAIVYLVIAFVRSLAPAIEYTVMGGTDVLTIVAVWVDVAMILALGVLAYFNVVRLNKIASTPEDNELFLPKEKEDNNIFKDLGF